MQVAYVLVRKVMLITMTQVKKNAEATTRRCRRLYYAIDVFNKPLHSTMWNNIPPPLLIVEANVERCFGLQSFSSY